jgi:hypothetical protein
MPRKIDADTLARWLEMLRKHYRRTSHDVSSQGVKLGFTMEEEMRAAWVDAVQAEARGA